MGQQTAVKELAVCAVPPFAYESPDWLTEQVFKYWLLGVMHQSMVVVGRHDCRIEPQYLRRDAIVLESRGSASEK